MKKIKKFFHEFPADFANTVGGWIAKLIWMPKIHYQEGAKGVRRPRGSALFILNHTWWLDAPMLCLLCVRRRIHAIAAAEMFTGAMRLGLKALRCIPVDRASTDISFMRKSLQVLRGDGCVAIFPEGILNPSGELLPFKQGAAMLALQAGVPVVPLYSLGNYQPFQRLQLIFGKPIVLSQRASAAGVQAATKELEEAMAQLKAQLENSVKPKYRKRAEKFRTRFAASLQETAKMEE